MKKLLLIFLSLFVLSSCVTNYYAVVLDEDATFTDSMKNSTESIVISQGTGVYLSSRYYAKKYRKIKYNNRYYWSNNFKYSRYDGKYVNVVKETQTQKQTSTPSYNYSSSSSKSTGGTVHVKGYYRKNGTYVRPHTRSAPRRR